MDPAETKQAQDQPVDNILPVLDPFGVMRDRDIDNVEKKEEEEIKKEDVKQDEVVKEETKKEEDNEDKEEKAEEKVEEKVEEKKEEVEEKDEKEEVKEDDGEDDSGVKNLSELGKKREEEEDDKKGEKKDKKKNDEVEEDDEEGDEDEEEEGEDDDVIDLTELSSEELDKVIDDVLKSIQKEKGVGKKGDSAAYKKLQKQYEAAMQNAEKITKSMKGAHSDIQEKAKMLQALTEENEWIKEQAETFSPYIDTLKNTPGLGEAVEALARAGKTTNEKIKEKSKERAIDSLYSFLEDQTGIDIRKIVDAHEKQQKTPEETKDKGGDVDVTKKNTDQSDNGLSLLRGISI
jgi:hypothetical protein